MVNRSKSKNKSLNVVQCSVRRLSTSSNAQLKCDDLLQLYGSAIRAIEEEDCNQLSDLLLNYQRRDEPQNAEVELEFPSNKLHKDLLGSLLFRACELLDDYIGSDQDHKLDIPMMLLNMGASVNYANDEQSTTCLMLAAKKGHNRLIESLLSFGAKVNLADRYGWTALFYASYFGQLASARCLLMSGAHINIVDCDGMSCLIWASGRGQCDLVELLLTEGASVNAVDRYHTSPLIWASRKGNTKIVEILLKNGASIDEQGMYGWSPLIVAVKGNHKETVSLLLKYNPRLSLCDGERMTALMIACIEGFEDVAVELVKNGAPVNQADKQNMTPLIFAARAKSTNLVKTLVQAGAYIEHEGQNDRSAIHWSIITNDSESYKLFLSRGIDTLAKNMNGETHLMLAAKYRSEEIIKLILEHNARANKKDPSQYGCLNSSSPTESMAAPVCGRVRHRLGGNIISPSDHQNNNSAARPSNQGGPATSDHNEGVEDFNKLEVMFLGTI